MLCVLILIERSELDEWAVRLDRCPLVETDDQSVNGKEKVVVRLLQSLGDGVKLSLVAAGVIGLRLAWHRAHETVLDLVCRLLLEKKKKTTKRTGLERPFKTPLSV